MSKVQQSSSRRLLSQRCGTQRDAVSIHVIVTYLLAYGRFAFSHNMIRNFNNVLGKNSVFSLNDFIEKSFLFENRGELFDCVCPTTLSGVCCDIFIITVT